MSNSTSVQPCSSLWRQISAVVTYEIKKFAKHSSNYVHDSVIVNSMTTEMHLWTCIHSDILLIHKDISICNLCKGQITSSLYPGF